MVRCTPSLVVIIATVLVAATCCLAQAPTKAPPEVPESEITELLKHNPFEFEFTVKEGQNVIGCPTIISPKGGGYSIDSTVNPPKDVKLPPSHGCHVSVLSRNGDTLRLKIDMSRAVDVRVTDKTATWATQNHTAIERVTLGGTATLQMPSHGASGAGPIEVTIAVRPFEPRLSMN